MADKEIGKINKGEFQGTVTDVVVAVREYNGRVGVDIREYTTSDKYTGPTKKGLRIPADRFQDFKQMINSISEADLVASGEGSSSQSSAPAKPKNQEELPDY
jgi:sporulation protein YlmC with PRC-barrel domain